MLRHALSPAVRMVVVMTLLLGFAYPAAVTAVAQLAWPRQAQGSLVVRDGGVVGSRLVGQSFTEPGWFWGRPSATSPKPYDPMASTGSNIGPTNPALVDAVRARAEALRAADPLHRHVVPVELVSASASGLDPQISPAAALWQVPRVAAARGLPADRLEALVRAHAEEPAAGFLGEARVNVLELNLALDRLARARPR